MPKLHFFSSNKLQIKCTFSETVNVIIEKRNLYALLLILLFLTFLRALEKMTKNDNNSTLYILNIFSELVLGSRYLFHRIPALGFGFTLKRPAPCLLGSVFRGFSGFGSGFGSLQFFTGVGFL